MKIFNILPFIILFTYLIGCNKLQELKYKEGRIDGHAFIDSDTISLNDECDSIVYLEAGSPFIKEMYKRAFLPNCTFENFNNKLFILLGETSNEISFYAVKNKRKKDSFASLLTQAYERNAGLLRYGNEKVSKAVVIFQKINGNELLVQFDIIFETVVYNTNDTYFSQPLDTIQTIINDCTICKESDSTLDSIFSFEKKYIRSHNMIIDDNEEYLKMITDRLK